MPSPSHQSNDQSVVPSLYIIAGPNGAGKTTFIKRFAPRELTLLDFANADDVERGLVPRPPRRGRTLENGIQDYQDSHDGQDYAPRLFRGGSNDVPIWP
jgi:hypothetical protein